MTTAELLRIAWDWEPSVVAGCAALVVTYALAWRAAMAPAPSGSLWRPACFLTGVGVLLLALVSPLDVLGDTYLFSMHMAQHLLLIEVVPPLLLLGVPPAVWRLLLRWPPADRAERLLRRPWLAALLAVGTLWAWHAPTLYEFALDHEGVHIFQHLTFLVTASIFWWPVIAPLPERHDLQIGQTLVYVAFAAFASSTLGIILTFSPPGVYPSYLHPNDTLGIVPLLRDGWGLTPLQDQRLGGGLMWMAGGFVYLLALLGTVMRWYLSDDEDEVDEGWRARHFEAPAGPAAERWRESEGPAAGVTAAGPRAG